MSGDPAVDRAAELRTQAENKRRMASLARRAGSGLLLPEDRIMMRQHADGLEAETAGLEAQADAIDAQR